MNKHDMLKKTRGIVETLIKDRTPRDVFEECRVAYVALGKAVAAAKSLAPGEAVPVQFAGSIQEVIDMLDSFRSGYASNDPSQKVTEKSMSLAAFAAYVEKSVLAALGETSTAKVLKKLYLIKAQLDAIDTKRTTTAKAESFEDDNTVSVPMYEDPGQIQTTSATSSVESAQAAAPAGSNYEAATSGGAPVAAASNAAPGSVVDEANKNSGPADVLKNLETVISKKVVEEEAEPWPMDMGARPSRTAVSFGRDRTPRE